MDHTGLDHTAIRSSRDTSVPVEEHSGVRVFVLSCGSLRLTTGEIRHTRVQNCAGVLIFTGGIPGLPGEGLLGHIITNENKIHGAFVDRCVVSHGYERQMIVPVGILVSNVVT